MSRKLLVASFIVTLLISFAGCSSNTTSPTQTSSPPTTTTLTTPTGATLLANILQSATSLKSFSYTGTFGNTSSYLGSTATSTANVTGQEDNAAQKVYGTYTVTQTGSSQEQFEIYDIGALEYTRFAPTSATPTGFTPGTWYKSALDAPTQGYIYSNNDSILFKSAVLTINGTETVSNVACWKVTAVPDNNQMALFLISQGEINAVTDLDQPVSNVSFTAWVAQNSNLVVREVLKVTMLTQGITVNTSFDTTITNINLPVTINLPADAANAIQTG
jgi:hypothetical protein